MSSAVGGVLDVDVLEDEVELAVPVKTFGVGLNSLIIEYHPAWQRSLLRGFFNEGVVKVHTFRVALASEVFSTSTW